MWRKWYRRVLSPNYRYVLTIHGAVNDTDGGEVGGMRVHVHVHVHVHVPVSVTVTVKVTMVHVT